MKIKTVRNVVSLRDGRNDWYTIKNLASGAEVLIYDEIGYFGVTAQDFIRDLANVTGPITLRLNTPGGEVFDGIAIYNALRARGGISVFIDGLAASIGSVIAMAADPGKLAISRHASMMIHDGFSQAIGNAADMRDLADLLDKQSDNIAGVYSERTGKPAEYWRDQMKTETWYTGQEAVTAGLADHVVDSPQVTNTWDLSLFRNVPGQAPIAAHTGSTVIVNADGTHVAMTGTHTHSHPAYGAQGSDMTHSHEHAHDGDASHGHDHGTMDASAGSGSSSTAHVRACPKCSSAAALHALFCATCGTRLLMAAEDNGWVQDPDGTWRFDPDGDGDDDSTPEGDTDHDYFDESGKQIKQIPPKPGAAQDFLRTRLLNADVDTSPWDASKAWSNGAASDDPAAFYKAICAGRKAGDPSNQSSWALPYKYTPSSAPNAAAVRNGLARISQTQGLTNKDEAQSLLESLMKKISPDYEASDSIDTTLLQALFTTALERS